MQPNTLSLIAKRVEAPLRHRIEPGAELARDLRLNPVDLWSIACDIEEALGFEFPDGTAERWETVGDIVQSMEKACV